MKFWMLLELERVQQAIVFRRKLPFASIFLFFVLMAGHIGDAQQGMGGGGPFGMDSPTKKLKEEAPRRRVPNFAPANAPPVAEVLVVGNRAVSEPRIRSMLEMRVGRAYDPAVKERDVRVLIASGLFSNVVTYHEETPTGVRVTYELTERPMIAYLRFEGNEAKSAKALQKQLTIHPGDPLNRFQVEENRRKLEEFYHDKGYSEATVATVEGAGPNDLGVVYQIAEGNRQRIWWTNFEGNTIATDSRLRTQVLSKPGVLWVFGGNVDQEEIEQDLQRITLYYRNLGYFRASVTHEAKFDAERKWLSVTYHIQEGQRYRVRNIAFNGNKIFSTDRVRAGTTLAPGCYVNLKQLEADTKSIRELYGNSGYIFADVTPEPKYLEEPGLLDIDYSISEGEQYRVGRIIVNIQGADAHTQRTVVLDRLTFQPGDIISLKEIRDSELRLAGSNLFRYEPAAGVKPQIVVRPPNAHGGTQLADETSKTPPTYRGQGELQGHAPMRDRGRGLPSVGGLAEAPRRLIFATPWRRPSPQTSSGNRAQEADLEIWLPQPVHPKSGGPRR